MTCLRSEDVHVDQSDASEAAKGPLGVDVLWRVEWRKRLERPRRPFLILAHEAASAGEARAFALAYGSRAWAGEFRLAAVGIPPAILDLRRLRDWDPAQAMPDAPDTLWAEELRLAAAGDELSHAVRDAIGRGVEAGVISVADGLQLVRLSSEFQLR